eukprot:3307819-Amphidinium_carterae.1
MLQRPRLDGSAVSSSFHEAEVGCIINHLCGVRPCWRKSGRDSATRRMRHLGGLRVGRQEGYTWRAWKTPKSLTRAVLLPRGHRLHSQVFGCRLLGLAEGLPVMPSVAQAPELGFQAAVGAVIEEVRSKLAVSTMLDSHCVFSSLCSRGVMLIPMQPWLEHSLAVAWDTQKERDEGSSFTVQGHFYNILQNHEGSHALGWMACHMATGWRPIC